MREEDQDHDARGGHRVPRSDLVHGKPEYQQTTKSAREPIPLIAAFIEALVSAAENSGTVEE